MIPPSFAIEAALAQPRVRWALGLGALFLVLVPLLTSALGQPFYLVFMTRVVIFALGAVGLDLILGFGGMISFGHAAFLGIGAYAVGIAAFHGESSALVQWPIAILASGLVGLFVGAVSLRTGGVYFIMITLAFGQMLYYLAMALKTYGGDDGMSLASRSHLGPIDLGRPTTLYYISVGFLFVALFLCRRLISSRFGMVLRGGKANERRMMALGFPVTRYRLAAFVLAAMIGGMAGVLQANLSEFVSPSFLAWTRSGELMFMIVLGGMGTLFGPVIGAFAFLALEEGLSDLTTHWQIILGPILLVIALFARRGLFGLLVRR